MSGPSIDLKTSSTTRAARAARAARLAGNFLIIINAGTVRPNLLFFHNSKRVSITHWQPQIEPVIAGICWHSAHIICIRLPVFIDWSPSRRCAWRMWNRILELVSSARFHMLIPDPSSQLKLKLKLWPLLCLWLPIYMYYKCRAIQVRQNCENISIQATTTNSIEPIVEQGHTEVDKCSMGTQFSNPISLAFNSLS